MGIVILDKCYQIYNYTSNRVGLDTNPPLVSISFNPEATCSFVKRRRITGETLPH